MIRELIGSMMIIILSFQVSAFYLWHQGSVTTTGAMIGLYVSFSGHPADCYLFSFTHHPGAPSQFNPYHGDTLVAHLDPADPGNTQLIAQLPSGNPPIAISQFCDSGTNELVSFACGYAYPLAPVNEVYAVQWSPADLVSIFGAASSAGWTCITPTLGAAAFYAPPLPFGNSYSQGTGMMLGAGISSAVTFINDQDVKIMTASTYQGLINGIPNIASLYIVGPAPSTTVLASNFICQSSGNYCEVSTQVTCPGTYWGIASNLAGGTNAVSVVC